MELSGNQMVEYLKDPVKAYQLYYFILFFNLYVPICSYDYIKQKFILSWDPAGFIKVAFQNFHDSLKMFSGYKLIKLIREFENNIHTFIRSIMPVDFNKEFENHHSCEDARNTIIRKLVQFEFEHYHSLAKGYIDITKELIELILTFDLNNISDNTHKLRSKIDTLNKYRRMRTLAGSLIIEIPTIYVKENGELTELLNYFTIAGLIWKISATLMNYYLIPASFIEQIILRSDIFSQASLRYYSVTLNIVSCRDIDESKLPPSREILEGLVAKILQNFGFKTNVNYKAVTRSGGESEVDVWAAKEDFRVYVSCKNWSREVDKSIIEEEFGRVLNLRDIPHLKILVAGSLTSEAKRMASADGFYVIELGSKVRSNNMVEICEIIQDKLTKIFTSIAPLQLVEAYRIVTEVKAKLDELGKVLSAISSYSSTIS